MHSFSRSLSTFVGDCIFLIEWKLNEPKPFPVDALPEVLADYVRQASDANGYDPSMIALPLLSSLARAIGNKRIIQPQRSNPSWTEPAIIWSLTIMQSGARKSPALKDATRFIRKYHAEQAKIEGDSVITKNFTGLGLWHLLASNRDTSILILIDELASFFKKYSVLRADSEKEEDTIPILL